MFSSYVCFVFVPGLCPYFHHVYFVLRSKPVSMFSLCLLFVQFQAFVHVFITFALCSVRSLCPCFHHVCFVFQAFVHVFIMFALCSVPSLCQCFHHVCFVFSSKPLSMFSSCLLCVQFQAVVHVFTMCLLVLFQAFVHVSTAYANCDFSHIEETVYKPAVEPQKIIDVLE